MIGAACSGVASGRCPECGALQEGRPADFTSLRTCPDCGKDVFFRSAIEHAPEPSVFQKLRALASPRLWLATLRLAWARRAFRWPCYVLMVFLSALALVCIRMRFYLPRHLTIPAFLTEEAGPAWIHVATWRVRRGDPVEKMVRLAKPDKTRTLGPYTLLTYGGMPEGAFDPHSTAGFACVAKNGRIVGAWACADRLWRWERHFIRLPAEDTEALFFFTCLDYYIREQGTRAAEVKIIGNAILDDADVFRLAPSERGYEVVEVLSGGLLVGALFSEKELHGFVSVDGLRPLEEQCSDMSFLCLCSAYGMKWRVSSKSLDECRTRVGVAPE